MAERAFQWFLTLLGLVGLIAGGVTVLTGAALIAGGATASASVDSELRFYAAWYAAAGGAVLHAARRPVDRRGVLVAVCAALLLAATGRAISLLTVGTPHRLYVVLMVVELVLPAVVGLWLAALARRR